MSIKKILSTFFLLVASLLPVLAQVDYQAKIYQKVNKAGDSLLVDVRITRGPAESAFALGHSDFVFTINPATLVVPATIVPIKIGRWSSQTNPAAYKGLTVGSTVNGNIIVRVRKVDDALSTVSTAFLGQDTATEFADSNRVVKLGFKIQNGACTTGLSGIRWAQRVNHRGIGAIQAYDGTRLNLDTIQLLEENTAQPLKNLVATPVLTCENRPLGVLFKWTPIDTANTLGYKLTFNLAGGVVETVNVASTDTAYQKVLGAAGLSVTATISAIGACDIKTSNSSTCTSIACPTVAASSFSFSPNPICPYTPVVLTITPNVPGERFSFDGGVTYVTSANGTFTFNNINGQATGDTTFNIKKQDVNTCPGPDATITLNINKLNNANTAITIDNKGDLQGKNLCNSKSITLKYSTSGDNLPILWMATAGTGDFYNAATGGQLDNTSQTVYFRPADGFVGAVKIKIMNECFKAFSGTRDSVDFSLLSSPLPIFARVVNPLSPTLVAGDEQTYEVSNCNDVRNSGANYTWDFGDGSTLITTLFCEKVKHTWLGNGPYTVTVVANNGTCTGTTSIIVSPITVQSVFAPNVLVPTSNSAVNSTFRIFGQGLSQSDFKLQIFSRWGEQIYSTTSLSEAMYQGWNGAKNNNGESLAVGTYTYAIKGKYLNGSGFEKSGNVTLLK